MKKIKVETNAKSIKGLLVILIIILAIPSIIYIVSEKNIYGFWGYPTISLKFNISPLLNGILFFSNFGLISLLYVIIIKNYNNIFKNQKEIFIFIIVISALFTIILPITSTDVFYYISTGWSESKYGVNPYYTSVYELICNTKILDDEILNKIPRIWSNQKIVYGPIWPFICKVLTSISFGNLSIALIIFKIFNFIIHLLNCRLIYKISNKKIFLLIYSLNPLILFEGLTNVHNDVLLIFFILVALYLAIKKKNIVLSVISLAIATTVKYVAILIVPFIVIYYFRKKSLLKRILNAIWLAIIFILVLGCTYLLYARDIQVIQGIFTQQGKYANSLSLIIFLIDSNVAVQFTKISTSIFILVYFVEMLICLFNKNVKLIKNLRIIYTIILIFILFVITNFQVWYIMWLLPFISFQNKKIIKSTINLSIAAELAFSVFFIFGESYLYGGYLFGTMIVLWFVFNKVNFKKFVEFNIN